MPRVAVPRAAGATGASAASSQRLRRYYEILLVLVQRDLKARAKQAYLGYFWIVAQPLLLTGVFTFLVQRVLGRGDSQSVPYPVFLMAALIPWQFFANSLNESTESLVKNVDLVRQVYFPREILAVYPVFARLVDVAVASLALALLMAFFHVPVSGWVVVAPLLIAVEMLFCAAVGLLFSAANVAWRDVSRALPLVLFLLLYAVPVLYTADQLPASIRGVYLLNPLARLIDDFRGAVLGTHPPDLLSLAVLAVAGLVTLVVAQRIFSVFDGVLADVV
ncbi:MAG: ABC transporter permease [Chloroflexi bacterium]|nr:ABC transporter permease [Chloroflexota bacterium]